MIHNGLKTRGYVNSIVENVITLLYLKGHASKTIAEGKISTPFCITCCSTHTTHLPKLLNLLCTVASESCFPSLHITQKIPACFTVGNSVIHLKQLRELWILLVNYQACSILPTLQVSRQSPHFHVALSPKEDFTLWCASPPHPTDMWVTLLSPRVCLGVTDSNLDWKRRNWVSFSVGSVGTNASAEAIGKYKFCL